MDDELLREVRRWRQYMLEDMDQAQRLIEQEEFTPRHAAWLAQQAAEKALKAVLVCQQIEFPFTHNLNALHNRIPKGWHVENVEVDLARLTEYAVDARYPGNWPDISQADAQAAVRDAQQIIEAVEVDLTARLPE